MDKLENDRLREGIRRRIGELCSNGWFSLAAVIFILDSITEPYPDPYEEGPGVGVISPGEGQSALPYPNSDENCNGGNVGASSLALPLPGSDPLAICDSSPNKFGILIISS